MPWGIDRKGVKLADQQPVKQISEAIGCLTDPIVVHPGGWGDTLPGWLKEAIPVDRLIENIKTLKEGTPTATDAEACAYLYTACLCFPLPQDWAQIYFYVTGQVMSRYRQGVEMPQDIKVETLTDQQTQDLRRLKDFIYRKRVENRQEKDRAERRQQREQAAAKKRAECPELAFKF
jgi:hypothetical protein